MDDSLAAAVLSLQKGELIIIIDEEREGEADLVFAAEHSSPEKIAFMLNHTSGIITVPLTKERAQELDLPLMVKKNSEKFCTNFTVSVDALHQEMTTGVSSKDRNLTIHTLLYGQMHQLVKPGHMFPLIGKSIQERQGHTETSLEMCKLAGLQPMAVICELMNRDGTMMNKEDALMFATKHQLKVVTIGQIINQNKRKIEKN
ncbi:MAG TPA: 3,4-dihydroxy-2-butanone-4-phosphate synthase [Candidatus Nanoarchaeia archaeon]|nr:3,4-dihydroxy-2-butanone-4-phosphate synthase [Candidatus Nanoarchaeia archaeon]